MMILKRLAPYWSSVSVIVLLLLGYYYPLQWLWFGLGLLLTIILTIALMHQPHWRWEYLGLSVVVIILLLAAYGFILIQENSWIIYGIITITVVVYFLFIKHLVVFLFIPQRYIPYSLEHISIYSNLLASFFLYVSTFIFFILGISRLRYVMLISSLATILLVWQTFWIQKIPLRRAYGFILVISISMIEGIWALHFWPVSFFVSGAFLTIGLYNMLHLTRHYLTNTLTTRLLIRYSVVSILAVLFLLLTAQWLL